MASITTPAPGLIPLPTPTKSLTHLHPLAVALLLGIVCVKKYLLTPTKAKPAEPASIVVGTRISIPDVEWSRRRKTMVVALHRQCPFCSQSAPFYKRLVEKANGNKNLQLVAVLPHDPVIAHQYLASIGVAFAEVRFLDLSKISVSGTPTILLLNDQGAITASWVGALSVDRENEVLRRVEEIAMKLVNLYARLQNYLNARAFTVGAFSGDIVYRAPALSGAHCA